MITTKGRACTLLSRTGLALSGLVILAASTAAIDSASAQSFLGKSDTGAIELRNKIKNKIQVLRDKKGQTPITIKSVRTKAPRDDEGNTKTQQIVVGKSDRNDNGGGGGSGLGSTGGVKRQVIVEPKPKKKIVVADPVIAPAPKKTKVVVNAPAKKLVVADVAPEEDAPAVVEPEAPAAETPADETATTETPAAPEQNFEVGQIVTGGDGKSYVVVKIDETGVSALPLSAFVEDQPIQKTYKKKRKKRRYTYGYSGSYGGSSCH
ncbi:MAG: hypothetical protein R3D57_14690 [Hyphomicrobiaceae bacterium]